MDNSRTRSLNIMVRIIIMFDNSRVVGNSQWPGTNNLAAYQVTQILPTIIGTITPAPNAAGWNTTNVVVHFSAGSTGSGIAWVTADITVTGATNDCEVTGSAMDTAGNLVSASVLVNIDPTPPLITLNPGDGATVDLSNPWLAMQFSDPASNTVSAGLNSSSLTITMDGVDVTSNFCIAVNSAVGDASAAPAGWHTTIISIADTADNVTSVTNTFYATGAVNPDAPTLANCNLAGGVVAPDAGLLWVQVEPSQTNDVVVTMSVNGGDPLPLDIIGQTAGGFVQVDATVTNLIVLYVTKTAGALQSAAFHGRHRKSSLSSGGGTGAAGFSVSPSPGGFHCEITVPGWDTFANGQSQTVAGVVSPTAYAGTTNETAVVSVAINGVDTTLSTAVNADGYLTFTTVNPVPVAIDGSSTKVNAVVCLANGQCFTISLAVLEGYEFVTKQTFQNTGGWAFGLGPGYLCANGWAFDAGGFDQISSSFVAQPGWESNCDVNVSFLPTVSPYYVCTTAPDYSLLNLSLTNSNTGILTVRPTNLGMTFGNANIVELWEFYYEGASAPSEGSKIISPTEWPAGVSNSITFNTPSKYTQPDGSPTTVLFTFEGMSYTTGPGDTMNLSNVTFTLPGATVDPSFRLVNGNDVSYLVTVCGATPYTINQDCFTWPAATTWSTNYSYYWDGTNSYANDSETYDTKILSFTGFHNLRLSNRSKIAIFVGEGKKFTSGEPKHVSDIDPNSDTGKFAQQKTDAGYYGVGIMGCWVVATIDQVNALRDTQPNKTVVNWVNMFTGGEDSLTYRRIHVKWWNVGESPRIEGPDEPNEYKNKTIYDIRDALIAAATNMAHEMPWPVVTIEVSGEDIGLPKNPWRVTNP